MTDVSIPAAFGAGLLSFVSPCVLPLAAPYLCYLAGASVEALVDGGEAKARRDILVTALLFVAGFTTVFVAFGATASALGALFRQWSHILSIAAGIGVILMGLHFLGVFRISAMLREARLTIDRPAGAWSAYFMGLAFALGWTPCIGPILATILAVASSRDTVAAGAGLLAVYSLGLRRQVSTLRPRVGHHESGRRCGHRRRALLVRLHEMEAGSVVAGELAGHRDGAAGGLGAVRSHDDGRIHGEASGGVRCGQRLYLSAAALTRRRPASKGPRGRRDRPPTVPGRPP